MVYRLAKSGWYSSNPTLIYNSPIDNVILAYEYELACREYEAAEIAINMEK